MHLPSDTQILQLVREAFSKCRRPEHFTNHTHCEECAEHDEVLRSRDVDSLSIDDVGNPGWDPICFITPEGFAYYFPALARLALDEPIGPYGWWYGGQLLFHLCHDGRRNERFLACTLQQRRAVARFLHHLVETRAPLLDGWRYGDELFQAMDIWSETGDEVSKEASGKRK